MVQKIVISTDRSFGLSDAAMHAYAARKGLAIHDIDMKWMTKRYWIMPPDQRPADVPEEHCQLDPNEIARDDPDLVAVVQELGSDVASGEYASLKIVEVPDGVKWYIDSKEWSEEWIAEEHRTWR